jgi:hypothetical protein
MRCDNHSAEKIFFILIMLEERLLGKHLHKHHIQYMYQRRFQTYRRPLK